MNSFNSSGSAGGEQRLFSQASFPEIYEQALVGPVFEPWVGDLFAETDLKPGDRILDIACGTGIVARLAKDRVRSEGKVVGVDVNPQMLNVARQVAPTIDWRQGDAGALPLADGEQFDVALCQQGFQFFPDRSAAVRQMQRALVNGGRLGVSTWRPDEEFHVLHELRGIAEKHVGSIDDRRHSLGEPGPLEVLLWEAGFHAVRSKSLIRTIRFRDGSVFVRLNATALVSMSTQGRAADDALRQRLIDDVVSDSAAVLRRHTDDSGFSYTIGTNLVTAIA